MIDLTPFYDDAGHYHSEIAAPFSDAAYTYATDGKVIVRVPRRPDVEESPFSPRADRLFAEATANKEREWFDIPELPEPVTIPCGCEDAPDPCPDCGGAGTVELIRSVDIGDIPFQRKYLALIKTLPACRISPSGKAGAWFMFDGGDGLLMPMTERRP